MNDEDDALAHELLRAERGPSRAVLERVTDGLSGASVFRVVESGHALRYVKIARNGAAAHLREEVARTAWLAARGVRVPRALLVDDRPDRIAVIADSVPGISADAVALSAAGLIDALAKGLSALHALPLAGCPFDETLAARLPRAAAAIAAGEVDPGAFEPRNRDVAPEALLARLVANQPGEEDLVVVHGDATLSNLAIDERGILGFIDCGNAGRADRYVDLALLSAEIECRHGAQVAARFTAAYCEHAWDPVKARFYCDLYELF